MERMAAETYKWLKWQFSVWRVPLRGGERWPESAGLYVFARLESKTKEAPRYTALRVGQCLDFSDRLPTHERWKEAVQLGMTHVHLREVKSQARRDQIECLIWNEFDPPVNRNAPKGCRRYLRKLKKEGGPQDLIRELQEALYG